MANEGWMVGIPDPKNMILREAQHTPVSHTPDIPFHPQMIQEFLHKLLVGGLGYAPGGLLESS